MFNAGNIFGVVLEDSPRRVLGLLVRGGYVRVATIGVFERTHLHEVEGCSGFAGAAVYHEHHVSLLARVEWLRPVSLHIGGEFDCSHGGHCGWSYGISTRKVSVPTTTLLDVRAYFG